MNPFAVTSIALGLLWWLTRPKVPVVQKVPLPTTPGSKYTPVPSPNTTPGTASPETQPAPSTTPQTSPPAPSAAQHQATILKPIASPSRLPPQEGFGVAGGTSGAVWWIGPIGQTESQECIWLVISPGEVFLRAEDTNVLKYVGPCHTLFPQGKVVELLGPSDLVSFAIADIGLDVV